MKKRLINTLRISITIILLLTINLLSSCHNEVSQKNYSYYSFFSQPPDPSFSFEYPEFCSITYEPYSDDSLIVEIWDTKTRELLVHFDAGRISFWEKYGSLDPKLIMADYITDHSNTDEFQFFRITDNTTIMIDQYEAQYLSYSYYYVEVFRKKVKGKFLVFTDNEWTWQFWTEYLEKDEEQYGHTFDHLVKTFKILN